MSKYHCSTSLLKRETVRELSYNNKKWRQNNKFLDTKKMSKFALFYVGEDDYCQCIFCRKQFGNWVVGDDPEEEHRRLSPDCPFMNGLNVGNVSAEDEDPNLSKSDLFKHLQFKQLPRGNMSAKDGADLDKSDVNKHLHSKQLRRRVYRTETQTAAADIPPEEHMSKVLETPKEIRRSSLRNLPPRRKLFRCCSM